MNSVKSKSSITWIISNKISITFYKLEDNEYTDAATIFPSDTKFKTDGCSRFDTFATVSCSYPGIFTCGPDTCFTITDGQKIWKCTRDGVTLENQHKKLCEYFMDNGVLFEFDGNSTYLLLKNRRDPLTHDKEAWEKMVSSGALKIIHASGSRKLARMVKETELQISESYEKTLLEVCK